MRTAGIAGKCPRRWRTTTVADPAAEARPDLVGRDFGTDAAAVGTRWCGDITYLNTWEGWLYLATVNDLATRRVVGWAVADHLRTDLVDAVLTDALTGRRSAPPRRRWPRPRAATTPRGSRRSGTCVNAVTRLAHRRAGNGSSTRPACTANMSISDVDPNGRAPL